ncbi:hypothetical protein [Cohnella abietis]|uniref:hypothetical protein n=1 Tax=Cohnella abietis TaxID=2507935 RepID=UPI00102E22D3|nr:hypothetical protein [Cohnella abietis]
MSYSKISSNESQRRRDWRELLENFEQQVPAEVHLERVTRNYRTTGLSGGTIGVRYTKFSSNESQRRYDWRELLEIIEQQVPDAAFLEEKYDIFEQRGLEAVCLEGVVRYFRVTRSGGGMFGGRCTIFSSNVVWTRHVWRALYDIFEQRGLDAVCLEGVVRYFRVTRSGCGMFGGRCTIFSSIVVWMRHVWRALYDIFEQCGLDEARSEGDVRYFRVT